MRILSLCQVFIAFAFLSLGSADATEVVTTMVSDGAALRKLAELTLQPSEDESAEELEQFLGRQPTSPQENLLRMLVLAHLNRDERLATLVDQFRSGPRIDNLYWDTMLRMVIANDLGDPDRVRTELRGRTLLTGTCSLNGKPYSGRLRLSLPPVDGRPQFDTTKVVAGVIGPVLIPAGHYSLSIRVTQDQNERRLPAGELTLTGWDQIHTQIAMTAESPTVLRIVNPSEGAVLKDPAPEFSWSYSPSPTERMEVLVHKKGEEHIRFVVWGPVAVEGNSIRYGDVVKPHEPLLSDETYELQVIIVSKDEKGQTICRFRMAEFSVQAATGPGKESEPRQPEEPQPETDR